LRRRLVDAGVNEAELDQIDRSVQAAVDDATEKAKAAPLPDPSSLETEVFADGGSAWRN
jgi:acetoin:2,6-dichlorophenolindophenol oxidoreductase subunit alpha